MDKFEEIKKYKELLDSGAISKDEFDEVKTKLLGVQENIQPSNKKQDIKEKKNGRKEKGTNKKNTRESAKVKDEKKSNIQKVSLSKNNIIIIVAAVAVIIAIAISTVLIVNNKDAESAVPTNASTYTATAPDYSSFDAIEDTVEGYVDDMKEQLETNEEKLEQTVGESYKGYLNHVDEIDEFYTEAQNLTKELYANINLCTNGYYKLINEKTDLDDYGEWTDQMGDAYEMWTDAMSDAYGTWDDVLSDLYSFLDDAIQNYGNTDYDKVSDAWDEMYDIRDNVWDGLYDCREDAWDLMYDCREDVWDEIYDSDGKKIKLDSLIKEFDSKWQELLSKDYYE